MSFFVLKILLLLTSFFGTGNLATVSSFDPNWVRCFVASFSPFTMMALIILKLLIPVVLVVCTLRAVVIVTSVRWQGISSFKMKQNQLLYLFSLAGSEE